MSTKIDHTSAVEPHHTQTTVTAKASATPTSSPKISMFAAKSGFVIPKNKLSGSLIPIYRGGKKPGGSDEVNDESIKQGQRKTKWGPDLTQDTAVRKGRAVAYQIRIDQITKELSPRILEKEDNEDLQLAGTIEHHRNNSENSEFLELERREAIGEIMKLNPSYKPPADYKPLLKEAKVLVPSEIMPSDGNEAHYEELYVRISADTYEKVDAAVALIELLVTPVSVNPTVVSTTSTPVSGDNANVVDQSQGMATPYLIPPAGANQEVVRSNMQSSQNQPQIQFQSYHPGSWFPPGTSQSSLRPPSGFTFLPNSSSAPVPINPALASSNIPSLFGPGPVQPSGLGSVLRNQPLFLSRSQLPVLQRPFMPQGSIGHAGTPINPSMPAAIQPSPAQPSISAPPPFTGNQPMVARPPPVVRPLGPSPSQAVSRPTTSGLLPPDRPLTPAAGSSTQSQAVAATTLSLGLGNITTPPIAPRGPQPIIIASGTPPPNISSMNMVSPVSYSSRPEPLNHSIVTPAFTFGPQPQTRPPPQASSVVPNPVAAPTSAPRPLPIQSSSPVPPPMQPLTPRALSPNPSPNPLFGSMPIAARPPPLQAGILGSVSATTSSFTVIQSLPTLTAPKQLSHPNSGDFTFQPHRPQNLASQAVVPRPDPMAQPPLAPSFQPAMHGSSSPTLVQQGFPRPPPQHLSNQMNQTHSQISPFARNPTTFPTTSAPPRHPHVPQMVGPPRNASPGPHTASGGPFPPPPPHSRPGSSLRQQNYPPPAAGGWRMLGPNQHARAVSSNPGEQQQIYDPFSPTSASIPPLPLPARTRKQENNDPEYEDLMASVGVK
ncbi:uncharacterized protein LOC127797339 isoform X2 [Diospyros lotus]|uniref:uncharacterized protein LOC127797339 isoform X2 n=1 Tax=Diospyros lotus TaxID=55363 RepID=UPI0022590480|nr:uncharacterized protein LOC127797339 isoform X2 [Diospyros lotus]